MSVMSTSKRLTLKVVLFIAPMILPLVYLTAFVTAMAILHPVTGLLGLALAGVYAEYRTTTLGDSDDG